MHHTHIPEDRHVEISRKTYGPRFREELKPVVQLILPIDLRMIVGTVRLLTRVPMQALLQFEIVGVKLLLLPPVTEGAPVLERAAVLIGSNEVLRVPVLAHLLRVAEYRGLPPIVLPIVGVHAHIPLMVIFSVGAPDCFEMKNVEVHVRLELLYQFD